MEGKSCTSYILVATTTPHRTSACSYIAVAKAACAQRAKDAIKGTKWYHNVLPSSPITQHAHKGTHHSVQVHLEPRPTPLNPPHLLRMLLSCLNRTNIVPLPLVRSIPVPSSHLAMSVNLLDVVVTLRSMHSNPIRRALLSPHIRRCNLTVMPRPDCGSLWARWGDEAFTRWSCIHRAARKDWRYHAIRI